MLALSGFPLLSGFGIVVSLFVVVALVCALVILPPLLSWSGERAFEVPRGDAPPEAPVRAAEAAAAR